MATPEQFAATMRYLEAGVNLAPDRRPTKEQIAVYFDLLGDLPAELLHTATQRVLLEHNFATLPTAAAIRRAALDLSESSLTAGEAWEQALRAVRDFRDDARAGLASLPPSVAAAARSYGWRALRDMAPGDTSTVFAQFRGIYDALEGRRRTEAALPAGLRAGSLAGHHGTSGRLPPAVAGILGGIGQSANGVGS